MLNVLNDRLATAKANLREMTKLDSMLKSARQAHAVAKSKRSRLEEALAKERSDVDALTGLSITGLFHALLGNKEQRLEKERQELVAAKLKYDQAAATLEDLENDLKRLQDARSRLDGADSEYEQVLAEKAEFLASNDSETARTLIQLTQQISELTADQKELDEACFAGRSAIWALQRVHDTLNSAVDWGTWDLLGGGTLTTMAKHSRLDAAKSQAREGQRKLQQFQEELADADQRLQLALQIEGFSLFADYLFDGLIADWVVQSKILNAKKECLRTITRVKAAVRECEGRLKSVQSEFETVSQRKRKLVETASE